MRRIRAAAIVSGAWAVALWAVSVAAIWVRVGDRALGDVRAGAIVLSVIAVVAFVACHVAAYIASRVEASLRESADRAFRDPAVRYLAEAAAVSRRAALKATAPLRVVHAR